MFKKNLLIAGVLATVFYPLDSNAVTLYESINSALNSHPQIDAGKATKKYAEQNIQEQRAEFFPSVSVDGNVGRKHLDDKTTRALVASGGGAATWTGEGSITLTQPLFSGFSTVNRVEGAEERYLAAKNDLQTIKEDIALRSAKAHLNLMRSKELLKLSKSFLSDIQSRRKKIALMVKEGAVNEAELLQADDVIKTLKNKSFNYEEAMRRAEADYIEAVGVVPEGEIELGAQDWNKAIPLSVDDAIAKALVENPNIASAEKKYNASAKDIKAEKASILPHVNAEIGYSKQDQNDLVGGETANAQAMVRMGWNFSLGGAQRSKIEKAKQQNLEAAAKRQSVIRMVERDVRQKYSSMQMSDRRLALLKESEETNGKILNNFKTQYEGGKQSNLQLIGAQAKLFDSKTSRMDAYYSGILSRLDLLKSMGGLYSTVKL